MSGRRQSGVALPVTLLLVCIGLVLVVYQEMAANSRPQPLAAAVAALVRDPAARRAQVEDCRQAVRMLGLGARRPSEHAAQIILDIIARRDD